MEKEHTTQYVSLSEINDTINQFESEGWRLIQSADPKREGLFGEYVLLVFER